MDKLNLRRLKGWKTLQSIPCGMLILQVIHDDHEFPERSILI